MIDLPFRGATFDAVVGNYVIAHFTKYQTALDLLRVLRPGGRLAMTAWSDGQDEIARTWLELIWSVVPRDILEAAMAEAMLARLVPPPGRHVEETLLDAGLQQVRTERPSSTRFRYSLDEYVRGLGTWATGRFVRSMLGDRGFESFLARARETFEERFADPVLDFRDVLVAVGTKP